MSAPLSSPGSRRLAPVTGRRDLAIAIGAGLTVLAFILFAVYDFSRQANTTGGVEGIIMAKTFTPLPETQITFGRNGLSSRELAGEYRFQLRGPAPERRIYTLIVDPQTYNSRQVGDPFYFVAPPPAH